MKFWSLSTHPYVSRNMDECQFITGRLSCCFISAICKPTGMNGDCFVVLRWNIFRVGCHVQYLPQYVANFMHLVCTAPTIRTVASKCNTVRLVYRKATFVSVSVLLLCLTKAHLKSSQAVFNSCKALNYKLTRNIWEPQIGQLELCECQKSK